MVFGDQNIIDDADDDIIGDATDGDDGDQNIDGSDCGFGVFFCFFFMYKKTQTP